MSDKYNHPIGTRLLLVAIFAVGVIYGVSQIPWHSHGGHGDHGAHGEMHDGHGDHGHGEGDHEHDSSGGH